MSECVCVLDTIRLNSNRFLHVLDTSTIQAAAVMCADQAQYLQSANITLLVPAGRILQRLPKYLCLL